jgi:PAS domain S-box-containing protein
MLGIACRVGKLGGWVFSVADQRLTWSDETAAIHDESAGFSPSSVERALAYFRPEQREPLRKAFETCALTGAAFDAEMEITTATGRHAWVRSVGEAVRDNAGAITHVQGAFQDISEQKLGAEQLRDVAARLHETVELLPDAFFTLNREWQFTYLNGEAERLLDRERAQLLGHDIWQEFQAAVGTESDRAYHQAMDQRVPARFEQAYAPLDRWFSVDAYPIPDGIAVYFRDGTERHLVAEGHRAQVEGMYRGLLDAAPDAMIVVSASGEMVILNAQAEKMFGYQREELLGRPTELLIPERFRHGHAVHRAAFLADPCVRGLSNATELFALHKDGREFPVEISLSPLASPEGTLVTAAIRDISARKAAERHLAVTEGRYRGLLHAAPDAMLLLNAGGEIVLVNQQAEKQFGYASVALVGHQVAKIIPEGVGEPLTATRVESIARHQDGREFPVEISLSPLESAEGPLIAVAIRDISARKNAEAHLLRTLKELSRSNEELRQFAYVASHDLQEPLRMVASYTQLLSNRYKGKLDSSADEFIAFAVDGANRMQRMIQDLLAYSHVDTTNDVLPCTPSEEALQRAIANLASAIADSGALVTHEPLPTVLADAGQLVQLFQNLLGNAIKYQGPGIPRVHVSCLKEGETSWQFSVADNGLGIDPRHFERIFGMFQRLHGREEFAGTGIGLAICKKIVERHGGRLSVESALGKGSTFRFTLARGEACQ